MAIDSTGKKFTMADSNTVDFNTLKKQIQSVLGSSSWDLEDLCVSSLIKIGAKYKPVRHSTLTNITDAQRKSVNWGMLAKEMESIRTNVLINTGGIGTAFSSIPSPTKWEHLRPRGASYSEYNRIRDFDGYNHGSEPPMDISSSSTTVNLSEGGLVDNINFSIGGHSATSWGSYAAKDLRIDDLNLQYVWSNVSNNVLDGHWRMAVAVAVPVSASTYRWLIISSLEPLENFTETDMDTFFAHRIFLEKTPVVLELLKKQSRTFGKTSFTCIPFLAHYLEYDSTKGFYFPSSVYDKAITFPLADKFTMNITGFAAKVVMSVVSLTIKVNGTTYTASATTSGLTVSVPKSTSTNVVLTAVYNVGTVFGQLYEFQFGTISWVTPTLSGTYVDGTTYNSAKLEWTDKSGTSYRLTTTATDASLGEVLMAAPSGYPLAALELVLRWKNTGISTGAYTEFKVPLTITVK